MARDLNAELREMISIPKEVARVIFDLAVSADGMCSGIMDTEDVTAMRHLAGLLGVDPDVCTGEEFRAKFPHKFEPSRDIDQINELRGTVMEVAPDTGAAWRITVRRPETDEEELARFGGKLPEICKVGRWHGQCTKPADDPIHNTDGEEL